MIDWSTFVNWIITGLLGIVFGTGSAWVTYRYNRKRDDTQWERDRKLREEDWQREQQKLKEQWEHEQQTLLQQWVHFSRSGLRFRGRDHCHGDGLCVLWEMGGTKCRFCIMSKQTCSTSVWMTRSSQS
jgi:hypothetical protein